MSLRPASSICSSVRLAVSGRKRETTMAAAMPLTAKVPKAIAVPEARSVGKIEAMRKLAV